MEGAGADRLLAHGAAHAVRHRGPESVEGVTRLVHAALQGSHAVLVGIGGLSGGA